MCIGSSDFNRIICNKSVTSFDQLNGGFGFTSTKAYDRLGLDNEYTKILDVKVPVITVPVNPGRNLAVIIETAAMNVH